MVEDLPDDRVGVVIPDSWHLGVLEAAVVLVFQLVTAAGDVPPERPTVGELGTVRSEPPVVMCRSQHRWSPHHRGGRRPARPSVELGSPEA